MGRISHLQWAYSISSANGIQTLRNLAADPGRGQRLCGGLPAFHYGSQVPDMAVERREKGQCLAKFTTRDLSALLQ